MFVPAVDPPDEADWSVDPAWWFIFRGPELLIVENEADVTIPQVPDMAAIAISEVRKQYLGTLMGRGCWSAELAEDVAPPPGMRLEGLRRLHPLLDESLYAMAGRAAQIVAWDRDHQHCGRCGTPTTPLAGERARHCPGCGLTAFPRLSPAVIVLITRDEHILLARGRHFPEAFYGIIAGFVEPGESLEEAVQREVAEEVGLTISDVRYFASQPWPYPHALMIGFTASYAGGEIVLEETELVDAGWFEIDDLPRIPAKLSIARRLIDAWAAERGRSISQL